jgi:biotin carboxyl carrier protein
MQYEVDIEGRLRNVVVMHAGDGFAAEVDGQTWHVDAARIDADRLSLLVVKLSPERHTRDARAISPADAHGPRPRALDPAGPGTFGASCDVAISSDPASAQLLVHVGTTSYAVTLNGRRRRRDASARSGAQGGARGQAQGQDSLLRLVAPMPGKVVRVLVHAGDVVRARQPLVVVEAMKMENELRAGRDGRVASIHVQEGASVDAGALVVVIE